MMGREFEDAIMKIKDLKEKNLFHNYIDYIRFPFYKNLELNSRINFDFPITILIGANGSGKSSALHAVFGMPEGYSTGNFWFSTSVDPIEDSSENRPGFVYGYKLNNEEIEVVKTRIGKSKGTHYWEPSRPLIKWGMTAKHGKRNPTIKKEVLYLDFRSELSAYDKYFYFTNFKPTKTIKSIQDSIRIKSKYLNDAITFDKELDIRKRKIRKPIILSPEALTETNNILGKNYTQCKIIDHNLYSIMEGSTIYFKTAEIGYSEAFAGRGEFAVVKLVHAVLKAKINSLIILDEPEVSLHPAAQEKLVLFLLTQCIKNKHQIVISTHSPKFVEGFPDEAIKLFHQINPPRFSIKNNCHYLEAFQYIGERTITESKKIIYVEDSAASKLILRIIESMGNEFPIKFAVNYLPGGGEQYYYKAASYCQENEKNKFIILDGDLEREIVDLGQTSNENANNKTFLENEILKATGIKINSLKFSLDSSSEGDDSQKIEVYQKYLNYLKSNLRYFPDNKIPEDLLWDEDFAFKLLKLYSISYSPKSILTSKEKILEITELIYGDKQNYTAVLELFIKDFISNKNDDYKKIVQLIKDFERLK